MTPLQQNFIDKYYLMAAAATREYGVPIIMIIVQGGLESGWGTAQKMMQHNAMFGIKAFKGWAGKKYDALTWENYGKGDVQVTQPFRAYDSIQESINDYANLIANSGLYKDAKPYLQSDPLRALQIVGKIYATDQKYVAKVTALYKYSIDYVKKKTETPSLP